jgi:cytochrome bd ubiquinol oxidase subunit II
MTAADPSLLALYWVAVIGVSILAYVILDGFDLGVGILFGATKDPKLRQEMVSSIAPFWDGNETWLIVVGASLFAAFPSAYAIFLGAFYFPVLMLLLALIFRGVSFEFRGRGGAVGLWNFGFIAGSVIAAFVQGAAVGAMIRGIPIANGQYSGGSFDWVAPLPILTGIGLVFGYALLGASWLVLKSEDPLRSWARRRIPALAIAVVAVLCVAVVVAFIDRARMTGTLYADRPWGVIFPIIGLVAIVAIIASARRQRDSWPFAMTVVLFVAAFVSLAVVFWPYMIPYGLTVAAAAAPEASLSFLFWGAGLFVLPVVGLYTGFVYWMFRGKQARGYKSASVPPS